MAPRSTSLLARPLAALLCLALAFGAGAAKPGGPGAQPPVIQEISWRDFGLVLKASAPLDPDIFTLEKPHRFVLDLPEAEFADSRLAQTITIAKGPVKRVRLDQKPRIVRLVLDMADDTPMQIMQLGDRSTLLVVPAGQRHPDLAALVRGQAYQGGGQEIRTIWARESADEVKLHLRAVKGLTYQLASDDPARLQIRVPAGRYPSLLPSRGRLLDRVEAKTGKDGVWTLDLGLKEGFYQLAEHLSPDKSGLTLTWTKLEPRRFDNRPLVVIDPGHGGSDPGALGAGGTPEKTVCLALAKSLQATLLKARINAVLTRSTDMDLLLAPRLDLIDRLKADMFISLHANSHTTPDSAGTETFWREPPSQPFAAAVHGQLTHLLKRPDRGVKQERLYVIRHASVPSILVETGFISNPREEKMLADPRFQNEAAAAIAAGVQNFMAGPPLASGL